LRLGARVHGALGAARVSAQHQKLLQFAANSTWSDEAMLTKVRELVRRALERHGPLQAWIIDGQAGVTHAPDLIGAARIVCGRSMRSC